MTSPTPTGVLGRDRQNEPPTTPTRRSSGWLVALFAIPVLCCAGPALLAPSASAP